jgi:Cu/Ag efflux protein CusF
MNFPNKITKALIAIMMMAATAFASDVSWTRFKGTVKMLDLDKNRVTIQNESSDLITIPVDGNVRIFEGKDQVALDKLKLDDKIMLQYIPINQKLIQQMEQEEKARQKQLQGD